MGRRIRLQKMYKVAAVFDTETTNIATKYHGGNVEYAHHAFCHLYTLNDLRKCDLKSYLDACGNVADTCGNVTRFFRSSEEFLTALVDIIDDFKEMTDNNIAVGVDVRIIPVVCVYNMSFDLQTLMNELSKFYELKTTARSGRNIYTLDLIEAGQTVLRFWDTFWLDTNGLASMGRTCGLPKAVGDWDYDKTRLPSTPLTSEELGYARRDVEVIPAYLSWMLKTYPFINENDFGNTILTKTSLVRTFAKRTIGPLPSPAKKKRTVAREFISLCVREQAPDYDTMALRQACFRGGLTFTSANYAGETVENVASLDAVSMHHAHINGHYTPDKFRRVSTGVLQSVADGITSKTMNDVLKCYWMPFGNALNALIEFDNLRLKRGSVWEAYGIAPLAMDRFRATVHYDDASAEGEDESATASRESIRNAGYIDTAENPVFAFGKLMSASKACVFVTELELWLISEAYDYDKMSVIGGEVSSSFIVPPDYMTLQSNALFEMKSDAKKIAKNYDGTPYRDEIPATVAPSIATALRDGSVDTAWVHSWYVNSVKAMFNGVYGTQAQNEYKPDFMVNSDGDVVVDAEKITTPTNYKKKKASFVLYTYGMRISGWSRVHLGIAMMLIWQRYGTSAVITGGDTDSMKISLRDGVKPHDIEEALAPLHRATDDAINKTMRRIRTNFPQIASPLTRVGHFEVENCGRSDHYVAHMEAWNKARVSMDTDGKCHVTCAGVPVGYLDKWMTLACDGSVEKFREMAPVVLGYNTIIEHNVCPWMETTQPKAGNVFEADVTDYLGNTEHVELPEAVAVYSYNKKIGDTTMLTAMSNVKYLRAMGKDVNITPRSIDYDKNGNPVVVWYNGGFEY